MHFIPFSCYHRKVKLGTGARREVVERALEQVRRQYSFFVTGYVVMPEHVHLLVSEPEQALLLRAIQSLKQAVARRLALRSREPFWQARYYDFNVFTERKRIEKLRYMHRNPVKRGLVEHAKGWAWSSFTHYATGAEGIVEIESEWTARRKERMGLAPKLHPQENPRPSKARDGAPLRSIMKKL